MSAATAAVPAASPVEQRSHQRFPLQLPVEYKVLSRGRPTRSGAGATLNVSSCGVLFTAEEPVPAGSAVELTMSWPFLLQGVCPLNLLLRGRVVRCDRNRVAILFRRHEFRTAGARASNGPEPSPRVRS
ncbi:MAG TPA: PilZ domain-containing protein [Bryobacteraceae bacterium]|nr:PilZ domain-containing protein [Bryobacteraceae bacterium]HUO29453.1 PilZ domain-containing protein [Bryobacteraceae bacterium]